MQDLKITLIQTHQVWEDKAANLANYERLLHTIPETDLVLLPEMFQTGFSMNTEALAEAPDNSPGIEWLKKQASVKKAAFYTSLIIRDSDCCYNRGVFVEPSGKISIYDKRKLFGMADESIYFSAGTKETIVEYLGWKINLQICYDLRFPENIRNGEINGKPAYDLLLYVANWPQRRIQHWSALLPARAIENQCYVAGVNRIGTDNTGLEYNGQSRLINLLGEDLSNLSDSESICTVSINYSEMETLRGKLPFLKDSNYRSFNN
ncbi:nitrilase-related carbon-nitrogen hydrolase [Fluviicola sp.]|jgi:predicted amidohydrolase|uniref:nitrilase-related carbon-nitrogen hydrolase n=1 Tax=Fluviicola sp. TaxID=1917219 RepID=UPI002816B2E3|nr:nitrilase-related carbon-nitrogen hydrolase [Fluviicola sp.]MDR0801879.1 nitrilase family protein [Fluviicola sp.]